MALRTTVYQREVLYEELWREPATTVAKRYSISSVALAKICRKLRVPRPGRGYWAQRAVGKADPKPVLPPLPKKSNDEIVSRRRGPDLDVERIASSLEEGRAVMGPPIIVPDKLERPHPLIADAANQLDGAKLRNGLAHADNSCVDVVASPASLPRALRIMNTLLLALEERGMSVEVTELLPQARNDAESNVTRVLVGDEWIRFGIAEHVRQHYPAVTAKPPRNLKGSELEWWRYMNRPRMALVPSGRLVLRIKESVGVRCSWRDDKRGIEERLNEFIKQLFVVADAKTQAREEQARWREAYEAEQRREQKRNEREQRDARRLAIVREKLERWREARDIRELVSHARARLAPHPDCEPPKWLAWAEQHADLIDPSRPQH